jgi:transglutaminase-like putative cysteine protease
MHYKITHTTEYTYAGSISLCHNIAMLIPRDTDKQQRKKTAIKIIPEPDVMKEYDDFFGNKVLYFAIQHQHKKLSVSVTNEIEKINTTTLAINLYSNIPWEEARLQLFEPRPDFIDARQYISETGMTTIDNQITSYALQSFTPKRPMFEAAKELMQRIYKDFKFDPDFSTISTPVTEVMRLKRGVCQDFAHLAIACLRSLGLPARYVSGYIETLPPLGKIKLVGVDASHAWFAVFIPNLGWMDFDPTNNQIPGDQHITIGWGRDYADISPLKGVILSSGSHKLRVSVDVRRIQY